MILRLGVQSVGMERILLLVLEFLVNGGTGDLALYIDTRRCTRHYLFISKYNK